MQQAQNWVKFDFQVKFNFECQSQLPPETLEILNKMFCSPGPNLVILAWMSDEFLCGQSCDW